MDNVFHGHFSFLTDHPAIQDKSVSVSFMFYRLSHSAGDFRDKITLSADLFHTISGRLPHLSGTAVLARSRNNRLRFKNNYYFCFVIFATHV